MKKHYKISNKNRFISFLSIVVLIVLIGIYILFQHINGLAETKEIEEAKQVTTTQTAIKIEPTEVTEEALTTEYIVPEIPVYNIDLSPEFQQFTWNECLYFDVSYELELSILRSESGFDSQAVSYTGVCRGMGQLSRTTAKGLAKSLQIEDFDIYNAEHNIACSIYLVKQLRDYWRDKGYCEEDVVGLTLLSYNRGISGCYTYLKSHDIYDDKYVNLVLDRKADLEQYGEFIH